MKRELHNLFRSVSFKVLLIIVALVLPLNMIAIIYTNKAVMAILEQAEFNVQKFADYQMQELGKQMDISSSFLTYLDTENTDSIMLKYGEITDYDFDLVKMRIYSRIKSMSGMTNGGDGYFYYFLDRGDGIVYGNADGKSELITQLWSFLDNFEEDGNPRGWNIYEWNDKKYLILLMQEKQVLYGSAIRLDPYLQNIANNIEYPISEISMTGEPMEVNSDAMVSIRSGNKEIFLNIELDQINILNSVSYSPQIFWRIALLYLILIPLLYMVLRKMLISPLLQVNEAHRQIELGNGDYRILEMPSSIEYRELCGSFNRMVDHLNQLKIESYENEISRQKMELRNLQLQIKPHFLMNTFNIIFSLAQKKENGMIKETIIYLSEYFRYIFRNEKDLELFQKELQLIRGYVRTASIRFSGRVEVVYEIEPELDFVRVPPLLIHNFVENAVKYGIKQKDTLHIWLQGSYDDGIVTFRIENDGNGMSQEILERNRRMFAGELKLDNQNEHLGLYNSLKRLKYFYGDMACIKVTSQPGHNTIFTVHFPYNLEVEDEFVDCE